MKEVTFILSALEQGNLDAPQQLSPLVYDELRRFTVDVNAMVPVTLSKTSASRRMTWETGAKKSRALVSIMETLGGALRHSNAASAKRAGAVFHNDIR
jgi:hypothetical protein